MANTSPALMRSEGGANRASSNSASICCFGGADGVLAHAASTKVSASAQNFIVRHSHGDALSQYHPIVGRVNARQRVGSSAEGTSHCGVSESPSESGIGDAGPSMSYKRRTA